MTSTRRFEQDVPALLDDLYVAGMPDYRDDLVRQTAAIRQRPAWTFPERWLPMDLASRRLPFAPLPWRAIAIAALILILAAAAFLVAVGSRERVPAPFGPARNGPIAYALGGDIMIQDTPGQSGRTLISRAGGNSNQSPTFSPDGRSLLFVRTGAGRDLLFAANADGTHERQILDEPLDSEAIASWAPDGRSIAVTTSGVNVTRHLWIAHVDGSPANQVDLGDVSPTDVVYRPPLGAQMLVRGRVPSGEQDFYLLNADGTGGRPLGLPSNLVLGTHWDNSGPAWSLAGDRIAYNVVEQASGAAPGTFRIHVVDADGGNDVALLGPALEGVQEAWPAWSPDGHSILVHRWTWQPGGEGWLAVMPADGSVPAHDIGRRYPGGQDTGLVKAWSPDGTRILVRVDNTQEIYSIDPVSGEQMQLPWTGADLPDYRRLAP